MTTNEGRSVAVLTHIHRQAAIDTAIRFTEGLLGQGITVEFPPSDLANLDLGLANVQPLDQYSPDVELVVVFGGDGTILRAAEWALSHDIPLLGVNLGHVGFLAEADPHEIDTVVQQVVDRSWVLEERLTAEVVVHRGEEELWRSFAVNEVSIEKDARERMLEVMVSIDDRPLSRWGCDGVLVSTPTGSTAYAFSAGGPVVWPGVEALLLLPLSAHALFARPMVLGPKSKVDVELMRADPDTRGVVWCDGRRSTRLEAGMNVTVRTHPHVLRLARLSEAPFTDRLVKKFGLQVEGWRGGANVD